MRHHLNVDGSGVGKPEPRVTISGRFAEPYQLDDLIWVHYYGYGDYLYKVVHKEHRHVKLEWPD